MYTHVICVNPDECPETNQSTVQFVSNEGQLNLAVKNMNTKFPLSTILIFKLDQMQKLVGIPQYARYQAMPNGEIIPV